MVYHPNFKDPRTQKRVKHALGFVRGCFSEDKPHSWSTRYIDKYLGQQNNSLSNWLRRHLLITTNNNYNSYTGVCKEYKLNKEGYNYIKSLLLGQKYNSFKEYQNGMDIRYRMNMSDLVEFQEDNEKITSLNLYPSVLQVQDQPLIHDWINEEFGYELKNLTFEYEDKSNRLWHPLQRVRREHKKQTLAQVGLSHQYDIECCAPTLLHQYSQRIPLVVDENNKWVQGPMDLWLFGIQSYLKNKNDLRNRMAFDADIPVKIAKVIINALFAGAKLGLNPKSEIYKLLGGDKARIEFLKQYQPLIELRKDIKVMWDYIKLVLPKRTIIGTKTKKERNLPLNSKQKWGLYFDLERKVLNAVRKYLDQKEIKYFLEHDGWTTNEELNMNELTTFIEQETGFMIQLDYKLVK